MASTFNPTESYMTILTDYENYTDNETDTIIPRQGGGPQASGLVGLICSSVFMGLIVIFNVLSLLAFAIEKRLRTYNNYFIINLTIFDLLVGISLTAQVAHAYYGRYPFSQDVCKILTGVAGGIVNGSNISVVVICADRHQAVYDPINHFISRTKRRAIIINCLPWVIGFSFWLGYTTIWEFIVGHDNGTQCMPLFSESPITYMIQNVCKFHLPFVIIVVLYIRIIIQIRKTVGGRSVSRKFALKESSSSSPSEKTGSSVIGDGDHRSGTVDDVENGIGVGKGGVPDVNFAATKQTSTSQRVESASESRKATRTLSLIIVAFVVTWIPFSVISLLLTIDSRLIIPTLPIQLYIFFAFLTYGNSLLNPISYVVSQPLFRVTVVKILSCRAW